LRSVNGQMKPAELEMRNEEIWLLTGMKSAELTRTGLDRADLTSTQASVENLTGGMQQAELRSVDEPMKSAELERVE
jgi:hypothetical protein